VDAAGHDRLIALTFERSIFALPSYLSVDPYGLWAAVLALCAALRILVLTRRVRTLEAQAIRDPLTGAFNRRHLHACLALAIERRRRTGEAASLLLLDVDRFKAINDAVGHPAGDRVLKAIVSLVGRRARKVDVLFRLGGEEFALLLAGATLPDAAAVAEDLRRSVEAAPLVDGRSVSVSIGLCDLHDSHSVETWIEETDAALYRAKRAGRNRVAARRGGVPPEMVLGQRTRIRVTVPFH